MVSAIACIMLSSVLSVGRAATIVLTEDTVITEADDLSHVHVYDGASGSTSVTMTGGTIEGLVLHDTSSFEQTGGFVAVPHATGASTLTILGGSAAAITVDDQTTGAIHGGQIHFFAEAGEAAVLNITGGLFEADLLARDQATINLSGGFFTGWTRAIDEGIINVYGSGFLYDPTGAPDGLPMLSGRWFDGTLFSLNMVDEATFTHVNLLPEPSSVVLLWLAGAMVGHLTRR